MTGIVCLLKKLNEVSDIGVDSVHTVEKVVYMGPLLWVGGPAASHQ